MFRSKAATYAVLAVVEIAKRHQQGDAGVRAREVAEMFQMPAAYAAKVMTLLTRNGVLESGRGPRGGFRLAKPPEEISFLEIIEAVDGVLAADTSFPPGNETGELRRGIEMVLNGAVDQARVYLHRTNLADFLRQVGQSESQSVFQPIAGLKSADGTSTHSTTHAPALQQGA